MSAAVVHGHTTGYRPSPTYVSWKNMLNRCDNEDLAEWYRYGGRGIGVCARWRDFSAFLADMGVRPAGMSLDRIDTNGNYELSNCRWATAAQQAQSRCTGKLTAANVRQIRRRLAAGIGGSAIARMFAVSRSTVSEIKLRKIWR